METHDSFKYFREARANRYRSVIANTFSELPELKTQISHAIFRASGKIFDEKCRANRKLRDSFSTLKHF